jgi:hypothetical protein
MLSAFHLIPGIAAQAIMPISHRFNDVQPVFEPPIVNEPVRSEVVILLNSSGCKTRITVLLPLFLGLLSVIQESICLQIK